MPWAEIFINRDVSENELATAIGRLFTLEANQVNVISAEEDDWFANSEEYKVICAVHDASGEFFTWLDIIPLLPSLMPKNSLEAIGKLCEILNCFALTTYGAEAVNPYSWTLVRGLHDCYRVKVDPDLLDDEQKPGLKIAKIEGKHRC